MTDTTKLLPCPMCWSSAHVCTEHDADGVRWVYVSCAAKQCGVRTRGKWHTPGNDDPNFYVEVRDEWNRRAPSLAGRELVERLLANSVSGKDRDELLVEAGKIKQLGAPPILIDAIVSWNDLMREAAAALSRDDEALKGRG